MLALLSVPAYFWSDRSNWSGDIVIAIAVVVLLLLFAWFALLMIPVRMRQRRPITRRALWIPLLGSGLLCAGLVFGAAAALFELFKLDKFSWLDAAPFYAAGAGWCLWTVVFWLIARRTSPESVGARLHRRLIAGSALELLIAVPAHLVVRRRDECCAGIETGMGICFGVATMLVAFGPCVMFLSYRRIRDISR